MVTDNHYRWDFIQLSTDTKPTPATSPKVADGSTLYTSDDSKLYIWYKDQWYEKEATGGGGGDINVVQTTGTSTTDVMSQNAVTEELGKVGTKILTTADYNYPEDNPATLALWLLDEGLYQIDPTIEGNTYSIAFGDIISNRVNRRGGEGFLVLKRGSAQGVQTITYDCVDDFNRPRVFLSRPTGTSVTGFDITCIKSGEITSSLNEVVSGITVLDGVVGKTLNDRIGNLSNLVTTNKTSAVDAINEIAQGGGGGGVTFLTSSDYNYPDSNPDGFALWKFSQGQYFFPAGCAVYYNSDNSTIPQSATDNTHGGSFTISCVGTDLVKYTVLDDAHFALGLNTLPSGVSSGFYEIQAS